MDLALLQKYLNFWCSSSLDLFGSEVSSNSAANFANGLKGRPDESNFEDHICADATFAHEVPDDPVGFSEGHAALHEVLGKVGRAREALVGGL